MATKSDTAAATDNMAADTAQTTTAATGTSAAASVPASDAPIDNTVFTPVGVDVTQPPMLDPNTGLAKTTLIAESHEEVAAANEAPAAAVVEPVAEPAAE